MKVEVERLVVRPAAVVCLLVLAICSGCGEGWDAYRDYYREVQGGEPGQEWSGPERVFVVLGVEQVETSLQGIVTAGFPTSSGLVISSVRLSDLIEKSEVTPAPDPYRYDFTASDGYSLLKKRGSKDLLPNWENLHDGYLYVSEVGDLRVGWDEDRQPWGSALSAYNVKAMDGGTIELLDP